MKKVDLVVPCFNESEVLPLFYKETKKVIASCPQYAFTLIFVNDGSRDGTLEVIKGLAAADESVKYISFSRNFGKEAAMLAGMRLSSGDYVGILDADLQHSPELIVEMLASLERGHDVAAACRVDRKGESKLTSGFSNAFYKIINKISDIELTDGAQDFRVMKRDVVDSILSMPEYNRFSKGIFAWVGFDVEWLAHGNRERAAGKTTWSLRGLMNYAFDGIIGFSGKPLKLAFYLCALFAVVGAGIGIWAIVDAACSLSANEAMLGIIAALAITGAALLFVLGLIGVYVEKIYSEVKGRPNYIVKETNIKNGDEEEL